MNATRNELGEITADFNDESITAILPRNMSMLGIFGNNIFIDKGVYKEDGWVYLNGIKHRKWHIKHDSIRLWEPKLDDSISLYKLWKKASNACNLKYEERWEVVQKIIKSGKKKNGRYIAHVFPIHHSDKSWWIYSARKHREQWVYGFEWLDEKPKKVINSKLGKKLYALECRCDSLGNRRYKVEKIFFDSLRKYLPKDPKEEQIFTLTFNDDIFVFKSIAYGDYYGWEQQTRINKITTVKVL